MDLQETTGLQGQPAETLEALKVGLKSYDLKRAEVIVITDWQGHRRDQRYAVYVHDRDRAVLSEAAFGPRYGEAGVRALQALVSYLLDRGAVNFKERVVAPHEFARILEDLPASLAAFLNAGANPADPQIYLH